jgi:hypothetical protein
LLFFFVVPPLVIPNTIAQQITYEPQQPQAPPAAAPTEAKAPTNGRSHQQQPPHPQPQGSQNPNGGMAVDDSQHTMMAADSPGMAAALMTGSPSAEVHVM